MVRGIRIAHWFLYEARRILSAGGDNAKTADAELLARWVRAWSEVKKQQPTLKDVLRLAPYRLRNKACRNAAITLLEEKSWLRKEKRKAQTIWCSILSYSGRRDQCAFPCPG